MKHLKVGDWELFSFPVFSASDEVLLKHTSNFTEEFPSTTLEDWNVFRGRYPEMFMFPSDLSDNRSRIHGNVFLLRKPDLTVLVDTGLGYLPPEIGIGIEFALPNGLHQAGIALEEINLVFLSHIHLDHIGWASVDGKPTFPKAQYLLSKTDFEHLQNTNTGRFEKFIQPVEKAGQLDLREGETALDHGLTATPSPGHSPGHMTLYTDGLIIASDVLHHPAQVSHPEWKSSADWDAELAVQTRAATVRWAFESNSLLCLTHLIGGGIGQVLEQGQQLYWSKS
jgi:glyoxylase-like metal-dependent hydrolase (beta-lactamase superfamily II)